MFIRNVISFANTWDTVNNKYPQEVADLIEAISNLTIENIEKAETRRGMSPLNYREEEKTSPMKLEGCWFWSMEDIGWTESREIIENYSQRPIYLRSLGHIKNRLSVSLIRHRELLNRWLFTFAPIAIKNALIDIPIAVVLLQDCEETLFGRRGVMRVDFERTQDELVALSPLSHNTPFLIVGISLDDGPINVIELESESDNSIRQIVINKAIEFQPEYYQAGLGILNYFGTVLREKYPEERAKVRIEQDGQTVRMIVESENGNREIIEKALQEFEMVVRGEVLPEVIFESKLQVLELKTELRIAQMRIESQKDLLEHKSQEIFTLKQLIGHSLTQQTHQPLCITVSPTINVSTHQSNSNESNNDFACLIDQLQLLSNVAKQDSAIEMRLFDLEESIVKASKNNNAGEVKESSGLNKLRKFIDEANETGSAVNKFIATASNGIDYMQGIARTYNNIASWCGAPQVPEFFLGKKS